MKHWEVTRRGEWINRAELDSDEQNAISFEDLLKEMKVDEGREGG